MDQPAPVEKTESSLIIPKGFPDEVYKAISSSLKPQPNRGIVFERDKQRNAQYIQKGLTKPGALSYDTLRRAAMSVHVARICINVLKNKVTKTPWTVRMRDPLAKPDEKRIKEVTDLLSRPNRNSESFRTLLDKALEDLLVLDAVSIEKTRYPNGKLAELHFVDSATIRPVYDEYGNQDVLIPLQTKPDTDPEQLPVSYLQIFEASQYGGPESGSVLAAWPKRDFIHFHQYPQGSVEGFGYGLSPLEGVISVVSNLLNADNYNSTYFEEGAFPPVILHIAGNINQRDAEAFKEYMTQELTGHFHRPGFIAGGDKMELINLKGMSNKDMDYQNYLLWLAKLLTAAYGLTPQDIGLTDDVNRSTSETMQDLSNQKGYSTILDLFKHVIDTDIIWDDYGYEDMEFDWVAEDSIQPKDAAVIYDTALKNGTLTVNEVREKLGEAPFDKQFDDPMILTPQGYQPLLAQENMDAQQERQNDALKERQQVMGGEKPMQNKAPNDNQDEAENEITKSRVFGKAVFTADGRYKTWMDDRGYGQPFIWVDIRTGKGKVYKPPVAVNLDSSFDLEEELTQELHDRGLNVWPVVKKTYVEVVNELREMPTVLGQFEAYCNMDPAYDSEKWRSHSGGSRRYSFYEVTNYIDGFQLNNPLLVKDMQRVPDEYIEAIHDLRRLWEVEKELVLGDRRADQYIITHDKHAWGFDYQFKGDKLRWERTKDAIPRVLDAVPDLLKEFEKPVKKSRLSKMFKRRI